MKISKKIMMKWIMGCLLMASIFFVENQSLLANDVPNIPIAEYADGTLTISGEGDMTTVSWSSYKDKIMKVIVEEGITSIPKSAFSGYSNLVEVSLPATLYEIGDYAFKQTGIEEITIPKSVEILGTNSFEQCENLKKVTYLAKAATKGAYAPVPFYNCSNLKVFEIGETVEIIPKFLVRECGIEELTIPGNVTEKGAYAFSNCSSLKRVIYKAINATEATRTAMISNCENIEEVVFEDTVESIPCMFKNCKIKNCVIKGDVNRPKYRGWIFEGTDITDGFKIQGAIEGGYVLGSGSVESVVFEEGVEAVPSNFLWHTNVQNLSIPDSVTAFGSEAFGYMEGNVKEFTIGENVTSLGESFLYSSDCVETIQYNVANSELETKGIGIKDCKNITAVNFGENVKSIPSYFMNQCAGLESITIPAHILEVGTAAFKDCQSLNDIEVLGDSTTVGEKAFHYDNCAENQVIKGYNTYEGQPSAIYYYAFKEMVDFVSLDGTDSTMPKVKYENGVLTITGNGEMPEINSIEYRDKLTKVVIGEGITSISKSAFSGCGQLVETSLPDTLKSIEGYAFYRSGIEEFTVPVGVEKVGMNAFSECENLKKVNYLSKVAKAEHMMFEQCPNLIEFEIGETVEKLPNFMIRNCGIEEITIPENVKEKGAYSISHCSSLKRVIYKAKNATQPTTSAMISNCEKIEEVVFEDTVESIPCMFDDCKIKNCVIKGDVKHLDGGWIFSETDITDTFQMQGSIEGGYVFSKGTVENLVISEGVEEIPSYFLLNTNIQNLSIPDSVTTYGSEAFGYMEGNVKEFTIGKNVTSLGESFLYSSDCIETIQYNVENSELETKGIGIKDCNNIKSVSFGENVKSIPSYFMNQCTGLESITVPAHIMEVGTAAFKDCQSLNDIEVLCPGTVIGEKAFHYEKCAENQVIKGYSINDNHSSPIYDYATNEMVNFVSLDEVDSATPKVKYENGVLTITGNGEMPEINTSEYRDKLTKVAIGEGITSIPADSFLGCNHLVEVSLPDTLTEIGNYAFKQSGIEEIIIPQSVEILGINAFGQCENLKKVTYLAKAATKGAYVPRPFYECSNLKEFEIGETVEVIPNFLVSDCGIEELAIPENVTEKGAYAFSRCSSLKRVIYKAKNATQSTTNAMISNCENIEEVVFEDTVESIPCMFNNCKIINCVIKGEVKRPEYKGNIFYETDITDTFKMQGSIEGGHVFYKGIVENIVIDEGVEEIPEYFLWHTNVQNLSIPDSVTTFESEAFGYLEGNVKEFTIGKNVSFIGNKFLSSSDCIETIHYNVENPELKTTGMCIYDCNNITAVTFGENVTSIPDSFMEYCKGLKRLEFPAKKEQITVGTYAFRGCSSLNEIILPENVTSIGTNAFHYDGCSEKQVIKGYNYFGENLSAAKLYAQGQGIRLTPIDATNPNHTYGEPYWMPNWSKIYTCEVCGFEHVDTSEQDEYVAGGNSSGGFFVVDGTRTAITSDTPSITKTVYQNSTISFSKKPTITSGESYVKVSEDKLKYTPFKGGKTSFEIIWKEVKGGKKVDCKATLTIKIISKPVKISKVKNGAGAFRVYWKKNGSASGYQIRYSKDKSFNSGVKTKTIKGAGTLSKKVTGLKSGKTYYIQVRTYSNSTAYCSSWSSKKAVKTK